MLWISMIVALTFQVPAGSPQTGNRFGAVSRIEHDSRLYQDLLPHALEWREAVINRDAAVVVRYASPEQRPSLSRVLRDKNSWQRRFVFGAWARSLRMRLRSRSRIVMFNHPGMEFTGRTYVTVCYVTPQEMTLAWPGQDFELRSLAVHHEAPCQVFIRQASDTWWTDIEELNH